MLIKNKRLVFAMKLNELVYYEYQLICVYSSNEGK